MKKLVSLLLVLSLVFALMAGCASSGSPAVETPSDTAPTTEAEAPPADVPPATSGEQKVYYLNFKPEIADVYDEIAEAYLAETGVTLEVVTAAAGGYEQQLKSEMGKTDAPTLFQINGPKGYEAWKDYCADLSNTEFYKLLNDKGLAITDGDGVYGVPYVVEGYGIIYNLEIMNKYFALDGRTTTISSVDEINNFETLKAVVEDMTANLDALEIQGVFASTSLMPGEDWRWQTHLANIPITAEFEANNINLASDQTNEITFQYSDNYKNIFDLYINNSITEPTLLGSRGVMDSMTEFALGEVAMVQNGNWAWGQIRELDENIVAEENIKFMPIYTGIEGEEGRGLSIGTENFFAINKNASEEQQKLAADYLLWLYSSDTGKDFVTNRLNFIAPFSTFGPEDSPSDPLAQEIVRWMGENDVTSVPWNFVVFPGQNFKDDFGGDLLQYAQGQAKWEDVKTNVVENWKTESAA